MKTSLNARQNKNIIAWYLLNLSFAFMLCLFAPIETYYSNKSEFWFSIWQLMTAAGIAFAIAMITSMVISYFLNKMRISIYIYAFLCFLFLYFYIQGNYIPRNYGVLNGVDIPWDKYVNYGIASIVVALICFALFCIVILKFKKHVFMIGTYLSIFILCIQIFTVAILIIQNVIASSHITNTSKIVVTDNKMLNYSEDHNIIVFILDAYDGTFFTQLLDEDYETYSNIFEDFIFYEDTLGVYPTTKGALPYILTGIWYKNEQPYVDYIQNAYFNNDIYKNLDKNNYSVGIYASEMFLSPNINYENINHGTYEITNLLDFIGKLYKMVAFNYMPHQLKQYFFLDTNEFYHLKKTTENYEAYSSDVQEFERKLIEDGINVSEKAKCFRLYHLDGAHPPYTFGKDLVSNEGTTYNAYDEAAGNCMVLKKYLNELQEKGIYDNTTIVVMADHGQINYGQNPIFMIKNAGESHDFRVSNEAMSYEYLSDIWIELANGKTVNEDFISNCRSVRPKRRFLYYLWDDLWDREYMPLMKEMIANGPASDTKNLIFSGIQYKAESEEHLYSLGTQLTFCKEASTANYYCISGFGAHEQEGTWIYDKQAVMEFNIKDEYYNNLKLTLEGVPSQPHQKVIIYINDQKVAEDNFVDLEKKSIIIPKKYIINDNIKLTMEFPSAANDNFTKILCMQSIKFESTDETFNLSSQTLRTYDLGTT